MPSSKEIFERYLNPVFIETGSHIGDGIQQALNAGFQKVFSIELVPEYYQRCIKRFQGNEKVKIFEGASIYHLPRILHGMQEKCTFWLDSHNFSPENPQSMIIEELAIIATHFRKNHTILIDDNRLIETEFKIKRQTIKNILNIINPEYKIESIDGNGAGLINDIITATCI